MRERIMSIMSMVFEQPITENSSVDNVEEWDSLHHINLVIQIEKEFGIKIPDDDTVNMINFKLIEYIVNEQIQLQSISSR
jgi:acyl carrier protein